MSVLLCRLAGPMQAWGTESRFTVRDTAREPSKSGVIGLLCAALGVPRDDEHTIAHLARLRVGVRVDQEGVLLVDYQTAGGGSWPGCRNYGVVKADGSKGDTVVSRRYYLADANFLVGLEGEKTLLTRIQAALLDPVFPLFLGRKSYPPGEPVALSDAVKDTQLEKALLDHPWRPPKRRKPHGVRVVLESADHTTTSRMTCPLAFTRGGRRFTLSYTVTSWISADQLNVST